LVTKKFFSSLSLAWYENWLGRLDVVNRREAALVEGEAGAPAGIYKKQWLFKRDIAESPDEWHLKFSASDRDLQ